MSAFTDQDLVDIRRHCGYGALGGQANQSLMYWRYMPMYQALEYRLANMTTDEINLVQGLYLPNLNQLEADLYNVRGTLVASKAAVYTHNDAEFSDRMEVFSFFRKQLCAFFQIGEGPFFVGSGGSTIRMSV